MSLKLSALLNPTSGDNDHDHDDIHNNTSAATSRSHPSSNPADHQRLEAHATPLATIPLSSSPLDPSRLALAHEHAFAPAPSASSPTDTSLFHAHGSPVLPRGHSRTHSSSSLRSLAAPVEPTAQLEHPQPSHSPTLDQYHHGSGSPEYRRRHSFASYRISPPPRLAPIKSLSRSNSSENNSFAPSPQQPTIPSEPNFKPTTMDGDASTHDTMEGVQFENSADQSSQDIPMTPQIPQASTPQTAPETKALSPPLPNIKTEPSATPHESSPGLPATRESPRETTSAQADDTAKEETNGKAGAREESTPSRSSPAAPKQAGRKPTNSKSSAAVTKKGTAAVRKPASKKRKLNLSGTPSSKRSMTPASTSRGKGRKASHTPSAADVSDEDDGSQIDFDDAESSASGTEVYCICRRPDNHTWMIACDGGCDDWFHGKCVHIKEEDGDLIDRYVCPNCEEGGKGRTTWRPMCRLEGCRKPARVNGKSPSKYCTDDHGREFMRRMATGGNRAHESDHTKMKKRKKRTEEEEDEDYEESRGGVLKAREVATLARSVKDHTEFRQLGEGVLSPPPSNDEDGDVKMKVDADDEDYDSLAEADKARLREIRTKRAHLTARKHLLKDKERLFIMIRDRSKNIIEEMDSTGGTGGSKTSKSGGASSKDLCGFDPRVSWSDEELQQFRTSPEGVLAIRNGQIGSPTATDRQNSVSGTLDADEEIRGICLKRRCERHRQWRNILTMSLKMEQREVEEDARVLRDEEEDIRARGELRKVLGDTDGEGGTVEVVAA